MAIKAEAMDLLDCLTSPVDMDDPNYDVNRDIRRDEMLKLNDFESLKVELKRRGLKTSGDKLEMMIRLLLHIIDPSISYSQRSGEEPTIEYINDEDIKSKKARIVPMKERLDELNDLGPDSDDLAVLKRRRNVILSSIKKGDSDDKRNSRMRQRSDDKRKILMDGMTRQEIEIPTKSIKRSSTDSKRIDKDISVRAYISGSRDKAGDRNQCVL
eukprot:gene20091-26087_t